MPGLLRDIGDDDPLDRPRAGGLWIGGDFFANAAAKFWQGLLDELTEFFPNCSLIELSAPSVGRLEPDLLFPERALQRQLDDLQFADPTLALADALAELNLMGPPSPVQARLFEGRETILSRTMPPESLDAETFSYLLAWQFQWAGIPATRWNELQLSGIVQGKAPDRERMYRMTFSLAGRPLSEGLIARSFSLVPRVTTATPASVGGERNRL